MPPKELLLCDWDDTCIEGSKKVYDLCLHDASVEVGVVLPQEVEAERIEARWGSRDEVIFAELFRDIPQGDTLIVPASISYMEMMRHKYSKMVKIVPGTVDILEHLKYDRRYKLGLTTAAPRNILINDVMPQLNFPACLFDQIISAYDLTDPSQAKPSPYTLQKIMNDQGVAPVNCVMVGDAVNDYRAAEAAGVDFIAVETGGVDWDRVNGGRIQKVLHVINNVSQIMPILERIENS